jgi:type 1 glutamine amidotransferase
MSGSVARKVGFTAGQASSGTDATFATRFWWKVALATPVAHGRLVLEAAFCEEKFMLKCLRAVLIGLTLLLAVTSVNGAERTQRVLLIGQGPDGHPAATHEYNAGVRLLGKLLSRTENLQTIVVSADGEWADGPELLDGADAAVVFVSQGAKWIQDDAKRLAAFQALAKRGGGLACLHWGMGTRDAEYIPKWLELFGGCHGGPDRRYKVVDGQFELASPSHPVLRGVEPIPVHEEFYFKLKFPRPVEQITPLIRVQIEDQPHVVSWAWPRPDGGRSFGFTGLHFHENWKHESYRRLMGQGVLWTLGRDVPEGGLIVDVTAADLELPQAQAN